MPAIPRQREPQSQGKAPDGHIGWSAPFGVWMGAPLRLHLSLLLLIGAIACYAVENASYQAMLCLLVYLASLLAHEAAHSAATWRVGGRVDQLVIGPFGGLNRVRLPNDPEARVFVALAGPMANLALVLLGFFLLVVLYGDPSLDEPRLADYLFPSLDSGVIDGDVASERPIVILARFAMIVNWPLCVLNLLPAYPFDGGAAARSLLWPWLGKKSSAAFVARSAKLIGVACIVAAPMLGDNEHQLFYRIGLVSLGIVLCFGAQRDLILSRSDLDSTQRPARGPIPPDSADVLEDLWLDEGEDQMVLVELKQLRMDKPGDSSPHLSRDDSADEERLDEVLAKLHETGLDTLSREERDLLDRVSRRYRELRGES